MNPSALRRDSAEAANSTENSMLATKVRTQCLSINPHAHSPLRIATLFPASEFGFLLCLSAGTPKVFRRLLGTVDF